VLLRFFHSLALALRHISPIKVREVLNSDSTGTSLNHSSALLSLASAGAFPYYRATLSWLASILFFLANTSIVAVLSLYLVHALPPAMLPWGGQPN
jgi:hypothetical protein